MKSIRNFVQLTDKIGTAGQPREKDFAEIAADGYQAVINLGMPDHKDAIPDEGEIVAGLGMIYIHIPVPFDSPTPEQVSEFCACMNSYNGKKVFVHCIMNYRASAFLYHYLSKVVGLDEISSKSPMFDKWVPDATWRELLSWSSEKIGLQGKL